MAVIKNIGYFLLSLLVLAILLGSGAFIATVLAVGGAIACLFFVIAFIFAFIKAGIEDSL